MPSGKLYLIPNIIADNTQDAVITAQVKAVLPGLSHFLAEDIRTARRFLSSLKIYDSIERLNFEVLNKDTDASTMKILLAPALNGADMGIISESGCPGIADPWSCCCTVCTRTQYSCSSFSRSVFNFIGTNGVGP
jgi:16S rRNA (cytidine1402-2'-O)-methyltransferase